MATKKKPAAKPVKKNAKAKPAKKVANSKPKAKPASKSKPVKKAAPKKSAAKPAKKSAPAKKAIKQVKKTNSKTVSAKSASAKKTAVAAKKAAPVKPAKKAVVKAPAKKAAPVKPAKKEVPVAKKSAPVLAKPAKEVKAVKAAPAAPAKPVKEPKAKKGAVKAPIKTVTTFAKTALPNRPSTSAAATAARLSSSTPSKTPLPAPRPTPVEKKPAIVVARRVLENKSKTASQGKTMINYQPDYNRSILDEPEMATGPVYRYSDEELNEFKDLIVGRLDAARKELIYLQGLITRKDEAGTEDTENRYMNMEDGSGAMEREQLAQLASRQIQFINHLEKALMRIENKTYGICRVTGKLIDKARLRAVPHATLSIEAKKTMSNK